jgi:hypothetical protein
MTTKFDDLKYKQQQETEIEIQKLERNTVLMKGFSKWSRGPSWSCIVEVSFIGEENRSTRRKPLTCQKSLTNLIT